MGIKKLSVLPFAMMIPQRMKRVKAASSEALPAKDTYGPNRLAKALHPQVQHLRVVQVEDLGSAKSYYLAPDEAKGTKTLAWFNAGQYLSVTLQVGDMTMTRPYSLASSPRQALKGRYMLTVKAVDGGLASHYILDNWQVGTEVTASAPLGTFTYEPLRDAKTVVGIAGGSGITPFLSLAKAIADGDEEAALVLLYGSRTLEDALFRQELAALAAACPKMQLVHVLSHEERAGCEHGFITAELIRKYAPAGEYSLFLCGPQAMYDYADTQIAQLGLRRKFVRRELFGECFAPEQEGCWQITVRMAGTEQTITARSDESILRSLEKQGIAVPSHCRSGECGWCHSRLISGQVYVPEHMDGRREADRIYGYIHPCCSFPLSDLTIEIPPMRV